MSFHPNLVSSKAPFARASREDDYRTAWTFFEGTS